MTAGRVTLMHVKDMPFEPKALVLFNYFSTRIISGSIYWL